MNSDNEIKKCQVFGHKLAYLRKGTGETVLLVHGITTYSFIWQQVFSLLSKNYDVIAVDLLGCGNSDMPLDEDYSVRHHAELLHEFILKLGITKVHLAGHDVGGGICQVFAVKFPELLHDLSIINTVAYDFWPVQPIVAMRTPIIRQLALATLDLGTFKMLIRRGLYHKEKLTTELMDLFCKPLKSRQGRKAFLHFAKCLNNQHLMEIKTDLRELKMPVLIVRGDADLYLSASIAEKLHAEIPGSQLVRIPTGGHFIQVDEPEEVIFTLKKFFNRG